MIKFFKYIITSIFIISVVLSLGMITKAAAFVPTLPYVPPADVQIMDTIFNSYGLVKPSIEDDAKRLQAYFNLYKDVMGAGYDAFKHDMQEIIDNAKTSRTIVIKASLRDKLLEAMDYAINQGIEIGEPIEVTDISGIITYLRENHDLPLSTTESNLLSVARKNGWSSGKIQCVVGWNVSGGGYSPQVYIFPFPIDVSVETTQNTISVGNQSRYIYAYSYINNGYIYGETQYNNPTTFGLNINWVNMKAIGGSKETLDVQSQAIKQKIENRNLIPLTADTFLNNGVVDDTKPVIIRLPIVIPIPTEDVEDISEVQEKLGVVPISDNPAQTVTELREEALEKYGDVGDYSIDLSNYFPFCIPFDIGYALSIFAADPQAPSFDWVFPIGYEDGELVYQIFNVDLSAFDSVALVLRKGLDILFIIGLGMITRDKFLRG